MKLMVYPHREEKSQVTLKNINWFYLPRGLDMKTALEKNTAVFSVITY